MLVYGYVRKSWVLEITMSSFGLIWLQGVLKSSIYDIYGYVGLRFCLEIMRKCLQSNKMVCQHCRIIGLLQASTAFKSLWFYASINCLTLETRVAI